MTTYAEVIKACDEGDHNEALYEYYETILRDFIYDDCASRTKDLTDFNLLSKFAQCFDDYTLLVALLSRAFEHLNGFYL